MVVDLFDVPEVSLEGIDQALWQHHNVALYTLALRTTTAA